MLVPFIAHILNPILSQNEEALVNIRRRELKVWLISYVNYFQVVLYRHPRGWLLLACAIRCVLHIGWRELRDHVLLLSTFKTFQDKEVGT